MAKRSYETSRIRVHWNAERCIHTAICLTNLPEVFNLKHRPWVDINAAQADLIAATIEKCPSGALTYERLDGEPGEQPPEKTTITPLTNGPLMIQGEVEIRDAQGNLFAKGTRMTLCRCGQSQNHPFCDLSHRKAGFRVRPLAIDPDREQAQSPGDIQSGDGTR
jgi:uncharacterized Fe-S cluster protein YjdI/CDGSH-type Zn-finger protein